MRYREEWLKDCPRPTLRQRVRIFFALLKFWVEDVRRELAYWIGPK